MSASIEAHPGTGRPAAARVGRLARAVGSPLFWLLLVLAGLALPISAQVLRARTPPLPVLGTLPGFTLADQDGRRFGASDLRGYVWVAGFIFTRCPTICPAITATMARMQHRARGIEQAFRLVSFSVDPDFDTPGVLAGYARKHKASPRMWKLLTGPFDQMKAAVVDGLKIHMADQPQPRQIEGQQDFASIFHGTHFVLVDQELRVRGYYASDDPDVVDRVLHDAAMLVNRGD